MNIPVPLLPNRRGAVDYVVPLGVTVFKTDGRLYAECGDHIHGIIDKAGISLSVYERGNCPICEGN